MKTVKSSGAAKSHGLVLLAVILAVLFWKSFLPGYVHFSNDGPLGQQNTEWSKLPGAFTGVWGDLNGIGNSGGSFPLGLSSLLRWALGPVGYAKFLAPFALFILGAGAGTFFRQIKLSPLAATLGGAGGGVELRLFCTMPAGASHRSKSPSAWIFLRWHWSFPIRRERPRSSAGRDWLWPGLAVGINVMRSGGHRRDFQRVHRGLRFLQGHRRRQTVPSCQKSARGIGRVAVMIAVFAGFMATANSRVAGRALQSGHCRNRTGRGNKGGALELGNAMERTQKSKRWVCSCPDCSATKWTRRTTWNIFRTLIVAEAIGARSAATRSLDQYFENGAKGTLPPFSYMRQTGGGDYAGILVALVAAWAVAQSLRRQNSVFGENQRRMIWFWFALLVISLLLAFGRFGFFDGMPYRLLYALPYFSTIRNPDQIHSRFFLGDCDSFCLWRSCLAPALSGNSRRKNNKILRGAGPKLVEKPPRLRPEMDFRLRHCLRRQRSGLAGLRLAKTGARPLSANRRKLPAHQAKSPRSASVRPAGSFCFLRGDFALSFSSSPEFFPARAPGSAAFCSAHCSWWTWAGRICRISSTGITCKNTTLTRRTPRIQSTQSLISSTTNHTNTASLNCRFACPTNSACSMETADFMPSNGCSTSFRITTSSR